MVECATQELIQIQSSNTQRGQDEWLSQTNRVTSLPSARDSSSCSMLTLIRGYDHPPFINISPVFDFLVYIRVSEFFFVIKCNTFWNLKKSSTLSKECGHLVYRNLCAQCSGQWSTFFSLFSVAGILHLSMANSFFCYWLLFLLIYWIGWLKTKEIKHVGNLKMC